MDQVQQAPRGGTKTPAPAAAEPAQSLLRTPFEGRARFFTAIRPWKDPLLGQKRRLIIYPAFAVTVGAIQFQARTQEPIDEQDDEEVGSLVLSLSQKQPGFIQLLSHAQILVALRDAVNHIVRWSRFDDENQRPRKSEIINLAGRMVSVDPTTGRGTLGDPIAQVEPSDEPLSSYLVLLPEAEVQRWGGRVGIRRMPTLAQLEPSTVSPEIAKVRELMRVGE